jgi:adenosylmethionine-8-amino-7-oxononanoate aminotransferase
VLGLPRRRALAGRPARPGDARQGHRGRLPPNRIVDAVVESGGFLHGHTYFTNPLSCAIAHAVVSEMLDRDPIGNAARMGLRLRERLDTLAARSRVIGDVRGQGFLMAIELVADKESKRMLLAPDEPGEVRRLGDDHATAHHRRGQVGELVGPLERAITAFERSLLAD